MVKGSPIQRPVPLTSERDGTLASPKQAGFHVPHTSGCGFSFDDGAPVATSVTAAASIGRYSSVRANRPDPLLISEVRGRVCPCDGAWLKFEKTLPPGNPLQDSE